MQKDKIQILSTRFIDEATAAKAADANICIDSFSFIEVQPVRSEALKNQVQLSAGEPLTVIFTSTNAVDAVAEQIDTIIPDWKIFCTGGRTKELAMQVFGESNIVGFAKNAGALAERIIGAGCIRNITFFCGDQRLNELPETLAAHGIETEEIIVYTTLLTPVPVEKNYDGILFFSPSAVHSFFSMNTIPVEVALFSIGHTTTAAIRSYCTNPVITSDWPGTDNLLNCVTGFYNETSEPQELIS